MRVAMYACMQSILQTIQQRSVHAGCYDIAILCGLIFEVQAIDNILATV